MIRVKSFVALHILAVLVLCLGITSFTAHAEEAPQMTADSAVDYSDEVNTQEEMPEPEPEPETTPPSEETATEAPAAETEQTIEESTQQAAAELTEDAEEDPLIIEFEEEPESFSEAEEEVEEEEETEWVIDEIEFESEFSEFDNNDDLIAAQNIVIPPDITLEFRFTQVDKVYAVISNPDGALVYEDKSESALAVGEMDYYGLCYILEDAGDGWYYIESMNVRGFLLARDAVTGAVAERILGVRGEDEMPTARLLVARNQNSAYTYTHTTVQDVIAPKEYALASGNVNIYELRDKSSDVTGTLTDGSLCYILADVGEDWVFVESGNARGFVRSDCLVTGSAAENTVSSTGENNLSLATVLIEPEDNASCYYTLTSVKEASQSSLTRESMVNFALQFVGNPYVWGGTSLTAGADCSGFVQTIYSYFGYSIPRVAADQACYGMQIPIEYAEPGDLIFYAQNGYVYHVTMYIGDGMVVQAANSRSGIITSGIGSNAVWATRIIED